MTPVAMSGEPFDPVSGMEPKPKSGAASVLAGVEPKPVFGGPDVVSGTESKPTFDETNGFPTVTIDYKKFGVELAFVPTVLARGVINLRVEPSVSELDYANAVIISGFTVPALTKREARTTVELRDGQSFAIAGLLQQDTNGTIQQIPWLGSVSTLLVALVNDTP